MQSCRTFWSSFSINKIKEEAEAVSPDGKSLLFSKHLGETVCWPVEGAGERRYVAHYSDAYRTFRTYLDPDRYVTAYASAGKETRRMLLWRPDSRRWLEMYHDDYQCSGVWGRNANDRSGGVLTHKEKWADTKACAVDWLHWLPSGKRLSFEVEGVLYTVPAE